MQAAAGFVSAVIRGHRNSDGYEGVAAGVADLCSETE